MLNERYFLTDPSRRTNNLLTGPAIKSDGDATRLKKHQEQKSMVALPERLEAPDLFNFRFFRTPGTVIRDSGSKESISLEDIMRLPHYQGQEKQNG